MNKFGAGWFQIAVAFGLREALSVLLQLSRPQAIDLGALLCPQHREHFTKR